MDTCIVLIYCLCDDLLKWQHHRDDPQCVLSDAEIMTIGIVAALAFCVPYQVTAQQKPMEKKYVENEYL
jgi:hypothetical protein